ncbi:MAG: isoprenylcysteine carboxylmethyltransferase family protein [Candidatus Tectomicrobia bacterium]|uniref:Isoprenylcysteine carboxylmethyltransferase family protein n=1 Tax=Tectimicrobiota bacterium TaxID=2528274 RepID=A0A932GNW5_UNCTE|nr:isoprenylcysteine carboxylmethyltransferase family protein [Candidatus Tectomicrobia bacterium]
MEAAKETGYWEVTVIMVVIASWLLYRYVAPKGWREWSRAGLVQAFIIALYAEMYGFPLTIYVLSGFLGLDIPWLHQSGHLWATLFGWGDLGAIVEMMLGYGFLFFGLSLVIKGWWEVYHARREGRLATDRLYGVVRHPQYTGIFLAVFGQLIHWPTIPTLALFPIIVWAYVRLARKEEARMIERFGDEYLAYRHRVPMFFPSREKWRRLLDETRSSGEVKP